MAPLTLLTLPREIRNHIYSYLSKELQCDWIAAINEDHTPDVGSDDAYGLASGQAFYDVADVIFDSVPDPGILATHSCLRAKYLEEQELPTEGLSVCITTTLGSAHLGEPEPNEVTPVNQAFS
jgi:hypothetical protein